MLTNFARATGAIALLVLLAACGKNTGTDVAKINVDWTGNDIAIEAGEDPDVKGVICHVAYFNRSLIDRLQQGNWFEDPSYSAIDCAAQGPLTIGNINTSPGGEEIFVLRGELCDETRHPAGSWMRLHPGAWHAPFVETPTLLLVRSGHLKGRAKGR